MPALDQGIGSSPYGNLTPTGNYFNEKTKNNNFIGVDMSPTNPLPMNSTGLQVYEKFNTEDFAKRASTRDAASSSKFQVFDNVTASKTVDKDFGSLPFEQKSNRNSRVYSASDSKAPAGTSNSDLARRLMQHAVPNPGSQGFDPSPLGGQFGQFGTAGSKID